MRIVLRIVVVLTLALATGAAQQEPIDLDAAQQYFAEAKAASDRDSGFLWGVRLYGPMLFADPQSRFVVANQADKEGKLTQRGASWVGTLPAGIGIANYSLNWAGVKWTMVMWPALGSYRQDRVRLMLHESFHRAQGELGFAAADAVNNHLDGKDGRIWLQLEWRALDVALRSRGVARNQALADALYFRAYRRLVIPSAAAAENALEANEGLSEYTGVKLAARSSAEAAVMAQIDLRQSYRRSTFVRSFAYISGPAYGLLLDDAGVKWRRGLKSDSDLGALTATAYKLLFAKPSETEARKRASRYDGEEVIALETKRDRKRQLALAEARKKFVEGPVMAVPFGQNAGYTFNPNNVVALDDNSTVYPELRVSDEWGILNVEGGAMLVRENGMIKRVVVPASAAGATKGDGWEMELKPGWSIVPGQRSGDTTVKQTAER